MKHDHEYFSPFFVQKRNEMNKKAQKIKMSHFRKGWLLVFGLLIGFIVSMFIKVPTLKELILRGAVVGITGITLLFINHLIHLRKLKKLMK